MEPPTARKSRDPRLRHPGLSRSVYGVSGENTWTRRCARTGATKAAAVPANARTSFIVWGGFVVLDSQDVIIVRGHSVFFLDASVACDSSSEP